MEDELKMKVIDDTVANVIANEEELHTKIFVKDGFVHIMHSKPIQFMKITKKQARQFAAELYKNSI